MIGDLLSALFTKVFAFLQYIWESIFGLWNYQVLFSWLPGDIQSAVVVVIRILFIFALIHFIRAFMPF